MVQKQPEPLPVDQLPAVGPASLPGLAKGVARAVAQPGPLTRRVHQLAGALASVVVGTEEHLPHPKDRRFIDPAWRQNPLYRRWMQGYVAVAELLGGLVDDLEEAGTDWRDVERARFAVGVLTSGIAPTNSLAGNPAALKRAFDTFGASVAKGARNFVDDVRHNRGFPQQTDRSAFTVGIDLAITPGAVVYRDEVLELIHYAPSTADVFERPLHPYTEALLSAIPEPNPRRAKRRIVLEGEVPSPINPPSGCSFHPRCHLTRKCAAQAGGSDTVEITVAKKPVRIMRKCLEQPPPLEARFGRPDHLAACWLTQ